ncbi:MAG: class I SAM-dependent methyltransferase [Actinobacteria bacterium]|nr:class I SAM-dependent methyltransferase [Actinomycetota bacterium]
MSAVSYRTFTGTAAENYQRYFVPAIAAPVSAELLRVADLQTGERVLDVACGTGVVTRLATERVGASGAVTGVDVAPDMVELARSIATPVGAVIEWHEADAASLPLPDAAFDVVLCQLGLMFIEDRPAALREMHRVLAPGGRVIVNTPGTIHPTFELMERAIVEQISAELGGFVRAVFSMHDPDALGTLLRGAGFGDVSATSYAAALVLPAPAAFLWQYINLTPMGPFVAQAPDEAQSAMERQVVDSWDRYVVDGKTPIDQQMVLASGWR